MIAGKYVVSSNGEVLAEVNNMLTTNGLDAINRFLVGQARDWAGTIGLGAINSASTTVSSSVLQYEIAKYPTTLKSYRNISGSNQIVIKATLDPSLDIDIYELGLFPARVDPETYFDNYKITTFSEYTGASTNWVYFNGTLATTASVAPSPRVGGFLTVIPVTTSSATNSASIGNMNFDSSNFSEADSLSLLFYVSSSISSTSVTVTFADSSASTQIWSSSTVVGGPYAASAFYVLSIPMQTKSASISDPINSMSITFYGSSGSVSLDYLKFIQGAQLSTDMQLVSRAISGSLTAPIVSKQYSQPMDIEYYIQVT